jgi:hypothetical protein
LRKIERGKSKKNETKRGKEHKETKGKMRAKHK